MITRQLQQELKRRLPGIVDSYGGLSNFISFLREALDMPYAVREVAMPPHAKAAMYQHLQTIITYSDNLILVSPWNLFLDLRLTLKQGETTSDSVNLDEPYQVFNINGDLLYTVKNHFGIFGESRLDKNLIVNSTNTSIYFLKFKSYGGKEQIRLLLVNLFSKRTEISSRYFRKAEEISSSTITFINDTGIPINIYEIESSIINISSFNFLQSQYQSIIEPDQAKSINVDTSKYFYFDPPVIFEKTFVTNSINDIVFQPILTRLIFVGSNVDTTLLNRQFNRGLQYSNKPIQDIITLKSFI